MNKSSLVRHLNKWSGNFSSHTHKITNPTTWQIAKCHSPDQTEYPCYHLGIRLGRSVLGQVAPVGHPQVCTWPPLGHFHLTQIINLIPARRHYRVNNLGKLCAIQLYTLLSLFASLRQLTRATIRYHHGKLCAIQLYTLHLCPHLCPNLPLL